MKKNLLWIAACLLSAAMLVACNGDNGKQPETQDTTSVETVTEAEVDSTDADTAGESETVAETETLGESETETLGESETETLGESEPETLGESEPETLGESEPETTAEESTEPETTTEAETEPEGYSLSIAGVDISEFKIVTGQGVPAGHKTAIDDFIKWVYKATGKTITKATPGLPVEHGIYIVPRNQAKTFIKKATAEIENDGYLYIVKDGNLYISSSTGRGLVYGIYDFLEKYVGVRFYTQDFTHLREIEAVNLEEGMKEVFSPSFSARWIWTQNITDNNGWYFLQTKNNVQISKFSVGDNIVINTNSNHTIKLLLGEDLPNGQALPCMFDDRIYQKIKSAVIGGISANPNTNAIQVGQEDGWGFCRCTECQTFMDQHGGVAMATFLDFLNRLAADVAKTYPNVKVIAYAYFDTHGVPTNMTVHDNVIIDFCLDNACYQHALNDPNCEKNKKVAAELRGWAALCKDNNLFIYDYGWNWNYNYEEYRYNSCMIDPNLFALWDNFQLYLECGVGGMLSEGIPCNGGDLDHLRYYLLSHLMWNPSMTEEEFYTLMDEFLEDYYGDAAPYMKGYIKELYDDERMTKCTSWNFENNLYFKNAKEASTMYSTYFEEALKLETLTAQQRLNVEYASMHLIRYICDFTNAPSSTKDQLTATWNEYMKTHKLRPWGY